MPIKSAADTKPRQSFQDAEDSPQVPTERIDWFEQAKYLPIVADAAPQSLASPKVIAKICEAITHGTPLRHAAIAAGISERTLAEWQAKDADFAALLSQARAQGVHARVQRLDTHNDPKWSAWLLARDAATRDDFRLSEHGPSGKTQVNIAFGFTRSDTHAQEALEHTQVAQVGAHGSGLGSAHDVLDHVS